MARKFTDLTGHVFGKLTVIKQTIRNTSGTIQWECLCKCGNTTVGTLGNLKAGQKKSCGCLNKLSNLTNQRFGKLIALKLLEKRLNQKGVWLCICDCGNSTTQRAGDLKSGKSRSCGCSKKLAKGESAFNSAVLRMKARAKLKNYEFSITSDEIKQITGRDCFYCGRVPYQIKKGYNGNYVMNGIDRVNSEKGYIINNIVSCCFPCNGLKKRLTIDEFRIRIQKNGPNRIKNHQKKTGW